MKINILFELPNSKIFNLEVYDEDGAEMLFEALTMYAEHHGRKLPTATKEDTILWSPKR